MRKSLPWVGTIFLQLIKTIYMANKNLKNGIAQDRRKVAGGQDYEVSYEKDKTNTSAEAVKKSVKKVGNERKKVEADLSINKK